MDSKSQEAWLSVAAKSRMGALCLSVTIVLVEALVVKPIWHLRPNYVVVTLPMGIASILGAGLMLFGIVVSDALERERRARLENNAPTQMTQPWFKRPMFQGIILLYPPRVKTCEGVKLHRVLLLLRLACLGL